MEKKKFERPLINKINAGVPDKFGMKTRIRPVTHIDNLAVEALTKEYGSPFFVISEKKIRNTFQEAKRAFSTRYPRVQFAWSYKTNYLNAVCNIFHQEGSWAEVVSGFEYEKALANGVEGKHIIFNGPGKSEADLEKAIDHESLIHVDHFDELYLIIRLVKSWRRKQESPSGSIWIRVFIQDGTDLASIMRMGKPGVPSTRLCRKNYWS